MSIPYEHATSGDRALIELQRTLAKFGCESFGTMTDAERGLTIVQFKWSGKTVSLEASWKGYAAAWCKAHPYKPYGQKTRQIYDQNALKQGQMSVCSVLRDWVKGQVTAVECGVMSFDAVFLPHMLLPNGQRVIDKIRADNLLPAPNTENVVELKR